MIYAVSMPAVHRMGRLAALLLCPVALALSQAGCSAFSTTPPAGPAPSAVPADPASTASGDGAAPDLQASTSTDPLRPGDVVRLRIWREPELSGDFVVNEDGEALLPRLGAVPVAGREPAALKRDVTAGYARYLQNPTVEIVLLRRVQILGAVRNPGLYPVDPTMTVSDALALAGGATTEGDPHRVVLIRDGRRLPVPLEGRTALAASSLRSGDQIYVDQRSWLSRNTGVATAVITGVVSLIIAFGTR